MKEKNLCHILETWHKQFLILFSISAACSMSIINQSMFSRSALFHQQLIRLAKSLTHQVSFIISSSVLDIHILQAVLDTNPSQFLIWHIFIILHKYIIPDTSLKLSTFLLKTNPLYKVTRLLDCSNQVSFITSSSG